MIPALTVHQLREALASPTPPTLLDVRTLEEIENCALIGITHIPLQELPTRLDELPKEIPIAVICRSGARSAQATQFLMVNGYTASNVTGGMQAWVREIDPTLPTP